MSEQATELPIGTAAKALGAVVCLLAVLGGHSPGPAPALRVAIAASTREPVEALASLYTKQTGQAVRLSPGSSGKIAQQLAHGAPFDLFFSADASYARRLETQGLTRLRRPYAQGRLVMWAPLGGFDVSRGWEGLRQPGVRQLAIANPTVAPYGRAALEGLTRHGLADRYKGKLVLGENAAQAAQFVELGGADAGLLPLSIALTARLRAKGRYWLVPDRDHAPLVGEAVIMKSANASAERFLSFCLAPGQVAVWARFGYEPVQKPARPSPRPVKTR